MNIAQQPAVFQNVESHLHLDSEQCPVCEQSIPREKFAQIKGRIAARERDLTARLKDQFAKEHAEAKAKAKAELDQAHRDGATAVEKIRVEASAKEAAALLQGRMSAEAAMQAQITAADTARQSALAEAEQAKKIAAEAGRAAQAELEQVRKASLSQIEKLTQDASTKEVAAREEGRKAAEAGMQVQLTEALQGKVAAETIMRSSVAEADQAKKIAEQAASAAKAEAEATRTHAASVIETLKQDSLAKEAAAREEGRKTAEAAIQPQLAAAEQRAQAQQELHDKLMNDRLQEQREALEKDSDAKVNAERSKAFEERQKLETTVQHLQRQIQNKTAQELGEGAEVDLFEVLKAEFPDDRITRIGKGAPGADVRHDVCHNGNVCGLIIYDSKNHKQWRYEFATKLREDQLGAGADHAILSTHVFPVNTRQLHHHDGVIIAQPARVVMVAKLLRQHILQVYVLRMSNEAREQKTEQLYALITSEHFANMLKQMDTYTQDMLDLEVKEEKAHRKVWADRGQLIKDMERAHGKLNFEIDRIIGTAATPE